MTNHERTRGGPADSRRRRFLLTAGAGGAAAVATVLKPVSAATPELVTTAPASQGYRDTEHVRDYYRTTKI
jgi:hypothetical protein